MSQGAPARTWPTLISQLLAGGDLEVADTAWAMDEVMSGQASAIQLAGFLVALRGKGETVEEVSGLVEAMLAHAVLIDVPGRTVDIVGTGGDRLNTVNISTMAAIVVAGTGATVVKHGNRAASSSTGSADVLERLGVRLDLPPEDVVKVADQVGITFCFAQTFHPAMRHAAPARRELGVPTAFNVLGPLTNPAQPTASAIGVADARLAPVIAGVFARRGRSALVFRGAEGLDELSVCGPSTVWTVASGQVRTGSLSPQDVGLPVRDISELRGGDPQENAEVVRQLLDGAAGAVRDAVLLNAAAALVALQVAADPSRADEPLAPAMTAAMATAAEAVDSGAARAVVDRWVEATTVTGEEPR
ncbi:MAG: anthranilate phosphoribosyltransferase [Actinomycetales bacterium]